MGILFILKRVWGLMNGSKLLPFVAVIFLAACGGEDNGGRERSAPLVVTERAATAHFVDTIEAVGTAVANEQVTLSAPVTERIVRLNFDDGGFVRAGQVIAVLHQGQQSAQLAAAEAQAREAQQQLDRITALKDRGFATNADYDTQLAQAQAARAQAGQVRAQISDRVIRAPFAGWVSLRNISVGAVVNQGSEIATISDIRTIKLDFPVPETMLGAIRRGQAIAAQSAAFPGAPFRGTIHTIDSVVDPNTRAVMVRARLPNPDRRLRPGMLLTVNIETTPRTALALPELAVVGDGDSRFVYVVGEDNRVKRTLVRTGMRNDGRIEIVDGIQPGDAVVTEGVVKLSDGMQVRVAGQARAGNGGAPQQTRQQGGQPGQPRG
jgi:membrane fusion protein, multidrug efflux system